MSQIRLIRRDNLEGIVSIAALRMISAARAYPTDYVVSSQKELLALEPDLPAVTARIGDVVCSVYVAENGDKAYFWPASSGEPGVRFLPEEEMPYFQPKLRAVYHRQTRGCFSPKPSL